jgi:hypothetical protein
MPIIFKKSSAFSQIQAKIENHLFQSVLELEGDADRALKSVEEFISAVDRFIDTLEAMYQNPNHKDHLGQKSFPIHNGRYRIFYRVIVVNDSDFEMTLMDIDDNRQSNLDRFPSHMITFDDES